MKLNVILFYTYEGRNYTLYFSSDHMFKTDLSVFSDFVTYKGAVGSPHTHTRRIAHLFSLKHLEFPKLMDFQNPVCGPAVLVAVNCQRGQACKFVPVGMILLHSLR